MGGRISEGEVLRLHWSLMKCFGSSACWISRSKLPTQNFSSRIDLPISTHQTWKMPQSMHSEVVKIEGDTNFFVRNNHIGTCPTDLRSNIVTSKYHLIVDQSPISVSQTKMLRWRDQKKFSLEHAIRFFMGPKNSKYFSWTLSVFKILKIFPFLKILVWPKNGGSHRWAGRTSFKLAKKWNSCFASLKNLKKHEFHFLQT